MKPFYLGLLLTVILFSSCQKELDFDTPLSPASPTVTCTGNSYMPLKVGNSWTYTTDTSTQTILVSPGDTVIAGKTYNRLSQSGPGTPAVIAYMREENGNVHDYINLSAAGVAAGYVNRNTLRANAPVGSTWSDTSIINGITEIFTYEIKAKSMTLSVDSKSFSNVIHVHIKVYIDFPPIFNNNLVQATDIYYAQCVGPVKSTTQFYGFGLPLNISEMKIKSYTLL